MTRAAPAEAARDGSPVELYTVLPGTADAEIIHAAIRRGGAVLELGCGAGRVTRELIARGHAVVAVDNSATMLEHVSDAETILADIEKLRLGRTFDAVVLASQLINTAGNSGRRALLRTCALHLDGRGRLVVERLDPRWLDRAWALAAGRRRTRIGGVELALRDVRLRGRTLAAVAEYRIGRRLLTHPFESRVLDDAELERLLEGAGLRLDRWLDVDRTWLAATHRRGR